MKTYDIVVQLGSQVTYSEQSQTYDLAPHTRLRTMATAIAYRLGKAKRIIICGGSNFGIRYDGEQILKTPDFSFEAFASLADYKSAEATVIKDYLIRAHGVRNLDIFAETLSSTTEENAEFLKIILRRRPMFTGNERIGLLTLLYHMEKALPAFQKAGLPVEPVFAENVLVDDDLRRIPSICEYYATSKGGKQYDTNKMFELLREGRSLQEMMS